MVIMDYNFARYNTKITVKNYYIEGFIYMNTA